MWNISSGNNLLSMKNRFGGESFDLAKFTDKVKLKRLKPVQSEIHEIDPVFTTFDELPL